MNEYYAIYTVTLQELIEKDNVDVFNFTYETTFKEELERRFIERYYFREIGFETYSMWHYKFKERWVNRVKHYNKLFEQYKDIDPLLDYKEVRNYIEKELNKGNESSLGSMQGSGSNESKSVQKDTPITAYDESDFASFINTDNGRSETQQSSDVKTDKENVKDVDVEENKTIMNENQLQRLNMFVDRLQDLQERFINEFVDLFMLIF